MSSRPADATDRNLPQKTKQQEQKLYGVPEYTNSLQVLNVKKKKIVASRFQQYHIIPR